MLSNSDDTPVATIVLAFYSLAGAWALVGLIARYFGEVLPPFVAIARAIGH